MHGYSKHNVINGTGAIAITRSVNSYMHKKIEQNRNEKVLDNVVPTTC